MLFTQTGVGFNVDPSWRKRGLHEEGEYGLKNKYEGKEIVRPCVVSQETSSISLHCLQGLCPSSLE